METLITTTDGSHSLRSERFDETYHSINGAVAESTHVFIHAGLVFLLEKKPARINILEVGFGTGLNAYLTLIATEKRNVTIHYTGVEAYPIEEALYSQLNYPDILNFPKEIFLQLHTKQGGLKAQQISEYFYLTKYIAQIEEITLHNNSFDLIYFDAFAPDAQPELWTEPILQKMFDCLKVSGVLVTYCAKGSFKRTLKSVGFTIEKLEGAVGKREMVRATKN